MTDTHPERVPAVGEINFLLVGSSRAAFLQTVFILLITTSVISGTVLPIPESAFAEQPEQADTSAQTDNDRQSDQPERVRPSVSEPRPGEAPPESTGVPAYHVDPVTGRTVWDLKKPPIDITGVTSEVSNGSPVPEPDKDLAEGFVAGKSQYLPEMSDEYTHVFLNPDFTLTVSYTQHPTIIDEATGMPARQQETITKSRNGWDLETTTSRVNIPDPSKLSNVPAPLATLTADSGESVSLSLRDQNPNREATRQPIGTQNNDLASAAEERDETQTPDTQAKLDQAFGLDKLAPAIGHAEDDAVVAFRDLQDGVSANIHALANGIKVDFVVDTPTAAQELVEELTIPGGRTFVQGNGIILLLDESGEQAGVWAGGLAYDAQGEHETDVRLELIENQGPNAAARVVVDKAWLTAPDRIFPVILDPVVNLGAQVDTWIDSSTSTISHLGSTNLRSGISSGLSYRSYLKFSHFLDIFDAVDGSEGYRVEDADLYLFNFYSGSCSTAPTWISRVTQDWDASQITWSNKPTTDNGTNIQTTATYGSTGCPDNWATTDVTNIVDYWSTHADSNHGFEIRSNETTGANFKQYYSTDYSNVSYRPILQVTYASHGAYFEAIGTDNGQPTESILPIPNGANGSFPLQARNRGVLNWPEGDPVELVPTTQRVSLSYHVNASGQAIPPGTWAGLDQWLVKDGARTSPTTQSQMADLFNTPSTVTSTGWAAAVSVRGSDFSAPGLRDVYYTAVHDGVIWFEMAGNDMLKIPTRWTNPPQIAAPTQGSSFSTVEPVEFQINKPYATGQPGAWNPTEYRVTFYNQLQQEVGDPVASSNGTLVVQPQNLGETVGPLSVCVQARDGDQELPGGPQIWTHCEWTSIVRTGVQLGVNTQSESFTGVDPATGNFYAPFVDLAPAAVTDEFGLVRHLNSTNDNAGIFGPGITTAFETRASIYPPVFTDCTTNPTSGDCTMKVGRPDGSSIRFAWDGPAGKWTDMSGGPTTGEILGAGPFADFKITFADGRAETYDSFGVGEINKIETPEGHTLSIQLDSAKQYHPTLITDEESGRAIDLSYTDLDPSPGGEVWQVTAASIDDGNQTLTWHYAYESGYLKTTTNPRGFQTTYNWVDHDSNSATPKKLESIIWPDNGRMFDLDYDSQGRVLEVVDGANSQTAFTYPTTSTTIVTDPNGEVWTIDYDSQARVTETALQGVGSTKYEYEGSYRDKVTDATGREVNFIYDADGNLLQQTIGANETTFYRYTKTPEYYADTTIISGPSHRCDARSADASDSTFCTTMKYDANGNMIYRATPGELPAEAEQWIFTSGSEAAVGGGTVPAGLIKSYRDGNIDAVGGEGVTLYGYDLQGDLRMRTDPTGLVTTWEHDELGRPTLETMSYTQGVVSESSTIIMEYDQNSNIKTVTYPDVANSLSGTHQLKTTYIYDKNDNVLEQKDEDLTGSDQTREWTYTYDELDRQEASFDPEGHSIVREFDANGNVTAVVDARLNRVETTYDESNNPDIVTAVAFDDGHSTVDSQRQLYDYDYDAAGRLERATTFTSNPYVLSGSSTEVEEYSYDGAGRLDQTSRTVGQTAFAVADDDYVNGYLTSSSTGRNTGLAQDYHEVTYIYTIGGRIETQIAETRETSSEYDAVGNATSVTIEGLDELTGSTTLLTTDTTFNQAALPVQTTVLNSPAASTVIYAYDERGLTTAETDARGNTTNHTYDLVGRLVQSESPSVAYQQATTNTAIEANWHTGIARPTIKIGYNTFGETTHAQDANGNITVTAYDRNGRRTSISHPTATQQNGLSINASESWTYDANGNTESYTSRRGHVTDFVFDDANRAVRQSDPIIDQPNGTPYSSAGVSKTYFDHSGRPVKSIDQSGAQTTMTYDDLGRVSTSTVAIRPVGAQDAMVATTNYEYSWLNLLTKTTGPEGLVTQTSFNTFGEPVSSTLGTGSDQLDPETYLYDGVGRIRQVTNPSGVKQQTEYDLAGHIVSMIDIAHDGSTTRTRTMTYDLGGNVLTSTSGRGATATNQYDQVGRLSSRELPIDDSASITYSYGYDLAGNSTSFTDEDGLKTHTVFNEWHLATQVVEPSATVTPTEPEADRRFVIRFDAGGQAIAEIHPGGRTTARVFNALGLPESETSIKAGLPSTTKTWGYDRLGRTIQVSHPTAPTLFAYDDRGLLVTQTGGAGTASFTYDKAGRTLTRDDDAGNNTFTYAPSTGLAETVTNGATAGGTVGGPLDVLLLVSDPTSLNGLESTVNSRLNLNGHTVTLRDTDDAETTVTDDLIVIASSNGLGSKYETQAVPIFDLIPWHWADYGMVTGSVSYGGQRNITITDPSHDLAASLSGSVQYADSYHGYGYVSGSQLDSDADVVGDIGGTGQHSYFAYETGDTLADSSTAAERRVGLGAFYDTAISPTTDGWALFDAAIDWAADTTSTSTGGGAWDISYDYDDAGRPTSESYADGGTRTYGYDEAGRLETDTLTDATATAAVTASTEYTYSCDDEVIAKDINLPGNASMAANSGSGLQTYTYDHSGRLTSWDDSATTIPEICPTAISGGSAGGPLDVLLLVSDPTSLNGLESTVNSRLNLNGHTVTLRDTDDAETTVTDDLIVVGHSSGLGSKYETQAVPIFDLIPWHWADYGMVTGSVSYGGQRNITITDPSHDLAASLSGSVQYADSYHGYGYVSGSQLDSDADVVGDIGGTGQHSYFAYETGDTLADSSTAAERRVGLGAFYDTAISPTTDGWALFDAAIDWAADTTSTSTGGGWTESGVTYTYDNRGNRLSVGTENFEYDQRNRLTKDPEGSYTWNSDGTLDTFVPNTGAPEVYTFDASARLTGITDGTNSTDYTYDAADRISTRDSAAFTYAGGELDPTSDGSDLFHRSPAGSLLAYETTTETLYPYSAGHHDINGLFDADGTLTDSQTYDPFGDPVDVTGTTNPVLGYQSDYTDPDTEHVWMGARWYQPSSGTFLSRDSYAGELATPFTLNRYTYAGNNPVSFWDPDGRLYGDAPDDIWTVRDNENKQKILYVEDDGRTQEYNHKTKQWDHVTVYDPHGLDEVAYLLQVAAINNQLWRDNLLLDAFDDGSLPSEGLFLDLSFRFASDGREFLVMVDALKLTYAGVLRNGYTESDARRSVEMLMLDVSNGVRCNQGFGVCLEADSGLSWDMVVEIGVDIFAGAICAAGVAAAPVTAGVGTAILCGAAVAIVAGLAGNLVAGRDWSDGLIMDGAVGGISGGVFAGAGKLISRRRGLNVVDDLAPNKPGSILGAACSFSAETEVLMADGTTKPISDVEVGDMVLAEDPETAERGPREVTHVWVHQDTIIDLEIDGHDVATTEDHPLWNDTDSEWQRADALDPGDLVLTADGATLTVNGMDWGSARTTTAYNLTINDIHTYYVEVGEDEVLVHNTCVPRFDGPKPAYHVNPAHVPGQGLRPGKTPLPSDAGDVFRTAVPNDPHSPTAWFGRNADGQTYRFSLGNDGTAHFSGIDGVGDGVRNLTDYAVLRLDALAG